MDAIFGIRWAEWSNIYIGAPLVVFTLVTLVVRWMRQKGYIQAMAASEHRDRVLQNVSPWRLGVKAIVYAISLICIAIALLRPQWGKSEQTVTQEGRDVVIALDVSRSMLAQDVSPDRLTHAKHKVQRIIHHLDAERVALVIFSGDAVVQCPLTRDRSAFQLFLDGITPETITAGTTAIESALHKAAGVFSSHGVGNRQRLLVLLTDGEDFMSQHAHMKRVLHDEHLHLFVMSVGTQEGAPIPEYDAYGNHVGYKRDTSGNIAISRCDAQLSHDLAHACGGVYVQGRDDDSDVHRVYQWVQYFAKTADEEMAHNGYQERYYVYVIPALIALCLEWIL